MKHQKQGGGGSSATQTAEAQTPWRSLRGVLELGEGQKEHPPPPATGQPPGLSAGPRGRRLAAGQAVLVATVQDAGPWL